MLISCVKHSDNNIICANAVNSNIIKHNHYNIMFWSSEPHLNQAVLLQLRGMLLWADLFLKYSIIEGIVDLNIIFSYMKFNQICNLDHPVY